MMKLNMKYYLGICKVVYINISYRYYPLLLIISGLWFRYSGIVLDNNYGYLLTNIIRIVSPF